MEDMFSSQIGVLRYVPDASELVHKNNKHNSTIKAVSTLMLVSADNKFSCPPGLAHSLE